MKTSLCSALTCATLLATAPARAGVGDLDPTFGTGGKAEVSFNLINGTYDDRAIAVLPRGSTTLLVGTIKPDTASGYQQVGLTWLDALGKIDTTYSATGKRAVETPFTQIADAAIDAAGRIYIAGVVVDGANFDAEFGVLRLLPDGELDASYGAAGLALASFDHGGGDNDVPTALTVSAGGAVLVAGNVQRVSGTYEFGVAKFTSGGMLDSGFSGDGRINLITSDFGGDSRLTAISAYSDGMMYVAGHAVLPDSRHLVAVASFNGGNGSTNTSFCAGVTCQGEQGSTLTGGGARTLVFDRAAGSVSDEASAIAVASDGSGRIAVVGNSTLVATGQQRGAIAVMNSAGLLAKDGTINFGRALIDLGASTVATDVVHRNADNHWIVSGAVGTANTSLTGFVSYLTAMPALDNTFTTTPEPSATRLIEHPKFPDAPTLGRVSALALDDQQRILAGGYTLWRRFPGTEDNDFAIARLAPDPASMDALFKNGFE